MGKDNDTPDRVKISTNIPSLSDRQSCQTLSISTMSDIQPDNAAAILGGQTPPPINALVLGGGIAGAKLQIANEWGMSYELVDRLSQTHQVFSFETVKVNDLGEIVKRTKKSAFYYTENIGSEITLDMVYIPSGSYMMRSPASKSDEEKNNRIVKPSQMLVNISAFYMSKYVTTQEQYQALMAKNPSKFRGNKRPVEQVDWYKAREYCISLKGRTNKKYVLPSESQWEYACRSGTNTLFYCGDTITNELANYNSKFRFKNHKLGINIPQTTDVDKFPPNSFGLYDIHGNVSEWCGDNMLITIFNAPTDGRPWMHGDSWWSQCYRDGHVMRGGSWFSGLDDCRSASRTSGFQIPSHVGFRVACLFE
jgi:formylglycine-generating enzyme required for sulfatase activity